MPLNHSAIKDMQMLLHNRNTQTEGKTTTGKQTGFGIRRELGPGST